MYTYIHHASTQIFGAPGPGRRSLSTTSTTTTTNNNNTNTTTTNNNNDDNNNNDNNINNNKHNNNINNNNANTSSSNNNDTNEYWMRISNTRVGLFTSFGNLTTDSPTIITQQAHSCMRISNTLVGQILGFGWRQIVYGGLCFVCDHGKYRNAKRYNCWCNFLSSLSPPSPKSYTQNRTA